MIKQPLKILYKRPFSLVELMIISIIITIIIIILGQKFLGFDDESKSIAIRQDIRSIEGALNLYYKDIGSYPTTEQGLKNLITNPNIKQWNGPYLAKEIITNPWGEYYKYDSHGDKYIIDPE